MNMKHLFCAAALAALTFGFGSTDAQAQEIKFGIGMPEGDSPEYVAGIVAVT